jgi:hypothetical protein
MLLSLGKFFRAITKGKNQLLRLTGNLIIPKNQTQQSMKRNILFALMLSVAGFAACNKCDMPGGPRHYPEDGSGIAPGGCFPHACTDVICTAQFSAVQLEVVNSAGAPVTLDAFVVTDLSGAPLPAVGGSPVYGYPQSGNGRYTVINDSWVRGHQNSSMQVIAKGFIKGSQVFSEPFTIVADCCHVSKSSGKDVTTIQ